jgi:hypothetical protein
MSITVTAELVTLARREALGEAAELANRVYLRLIGGDAVHCPCGNGRVPTQAYRTAVDAFAAAIRDLT